MLQPKNTFDLEKFNEHKDITEKIETNKKNTTLKVKNELLELIKQENKEEKNAFLDSAYKKLIDLYEKKESQRITHKENVQLALLEKAISLSTIDN